jgi:hypothetical protein
MTGFGPSPADERLEKRLKKAPEENARFLAEYRRQVLEEAAAVVAKACGGPPLGARWELVDQIRALADKEPSDAE